MNAFRVDEDMPIESGMLTRSLEGAQKKLKPIIMISGSKFLNMMRS